MILEGGLSVKAALLAGRRKVDVIYLDDARRDQDAFFILKKAAEKGVPLQRVNTEFIQSLASGRTHGGVLCEAESRVMQEKEDCLKGGTPFIALVEGVEDPFNLGYIMRSLYAAGCTGLILRKRDWTNAEAVILKSSAGASEYINVVMSEDLAEEVKWFKSQGIECVAAMRKDAVPYYEADYKKPVLIAIGGEMRGLSSGVRHEIDRNIYIPYANDFRNALNAAGAAAVLGFEVLRQRGVSDTEA